MIKIRKCLLTFFLNYILCCIPPIIYNDKNNPYNSNILHSCVFCSFIIQSFKEKTLK